MRLSHRIRWPSPRRLLARLRRVSGKEDTAAHDFLIRRLQSIIYRSLPPQLWREPLDPVTALDELRAWIDDEHQWQPDTAVHNWLSLLQDVLSSFDAIPHSVTMQVSAASGVPLKDLQGALVTLQQGRAASLNSSVRGRLDVAETALRKSLLDSRTLQAAWTDLIRAVKRSDIGREEQALGLLAVLADTQGKPWEPLRKRLWRVLGDDDSEICKLANELASQPEADPCLPPRRAGLSPVARLDLAERALQLPPPSGDLVVWLAYVEAHVPQFVLPLGDSVTLFEGRWLSNFLEHWDPNSPNAEAVPEEAVRHREECLQSWSRDDREEERRPFALVRIALGQGVVSEAPTEAHATAEALLRLASLYSGGRVSWRDIGSFFVFADGTPGWRTLGLDDPRPERGGDLGLAQDHTAEILEELEPTIGPHLPIADEEIEVVLDLLRWLIEAQQTWEPAKFLLCDRILEQVSAWAGEQDSKRFARKYLALRWARDEITTDIAEAVRKGVYSIDRSGVERSDPNRRKAFLEAIGSRELVKQGPGMKETYNYQRGLTELKWLRSWQQPGTDAALEIDALEERIGTSMAALRTFEKLQHEFGELLDRAQRTRNVVAHGGPISPGTLRSVGRFFEAIASDAVNQALHARMTGRDVHQHFADRQAKHDQCLEGLRAGQPPEVALFWKP